MQYFSKRLKTALDSILEHPLTVIEAGSGCGKTTAVDSYLLSGIAKTYRCYQYTSFGESANKSWEGLCKLLENVDTSAGHYLSLLGLPDMESIGEVAYQMSNVVCDTPTILFIDNFQLMQLSHKAQLLYALSRHRCPNLHFVIATQPGKEEPSGLSYFDSKIFRIGADTFILNKEEVAQFFQQEKVPLATPDLNQVYQMTEGLMAAVSLQLESWKRNQSFEPSNKMSQLMETVLWNHLAEKDRQCFVCLSVLERFTMQQGYFFANETLSKEHIETLLNTTQFINVEPNSKVYHFHYLLQMFLNERFQRLDRSRQTQIWLLAAHSCEAVGDYIRATLFYGRLKDYRALLELPFSTHDWIELTVIDKGRILEDLVKSEYRLQLKQYPELVIVFAFELFIRGNIPLHNMYDQVIQEIFQIEEQYEKARMRCLRGEYALLQSFHMFNDVQRMGIYHKEAFALLQGPANFLSFRGAWTFGTPSVLSLYWREPGQLDQALYAIKEGMPVYYKLTNGNGRGAEYAMEADVCFFRGKFKESRALYKRALQESEMYQQDCIGYCARLGMARLAIIGGDIASLMHMREKINDMAYEGTESTNLIMTVLSESYIHTLLDEYREIPKWIYNEQSLQKRTFLFTLPFAHIISGNIFLKQVLDKQLSAEDFIKRIKGFIQECDRVHMLLPKVYYKIYLAICYENAQEMELAVSTFREAFSLAIGDEVWMPFVEHYAQLQRIINRMVLNQNERHALEMIELLNKEFQKGRKTIIKELHPLNPNLTPREVEVAQMLQHRYSVKEIAAKLVISPATVSNIMQKIYSKLGIHSKKELYARSELVK